MGLADCGLEITSDEEADLESREERRFFLLGTGGGTGSADDGGRLTHRLRHRERIEGKDEKKRAVEQTPEWRMRKASQGRTKHGDQGWHVG